MAIKARNNLSPDWYEPEGQDGEEIKTKFKIKPLTSMEVLQVSSGDGPDLIKCLNIGLIDWENLQDKDGNEIKFSKSNFNIIPATILSKIANHIYVSSALNEEQIKNL